jgi:microcystin-dependent protein
MSSSFASRSGTYDMIEPVGGGGSHNNIQPSIVKRSAIKHTTAAGSIEASAKGTSIEGYWAAAPTGYLLEDGSAVSRTTYAGLFAVIGTTHGAGNGSTTFNLPDSRGRTAVNLSTTGTEFNVIGKKYGEKANTITALELPSHTHQMPWQNNGNDVSDYLGGSAAAYGLALSYASRTGTYDMLDVTGGDGSHNEIQPSIVKRFAIKF